VSWPLIDIGDCVEKVTTWNPSKSDSQDCFLYIDLSSVDKDKKAIDRDSVSSILPSEAPSRARQLVKSQDVLVATVRPNLNGVALITEEYEGATASTGYCVLKSDTKCLDSKYLYYWVQTSAFINEMMEKATGANYPAVSDKIIKKSQIPLAPIAEQKRIAAILDKADAIRRKRQQAIQLADDFLRSVFLDMFGDPVTNPKGWKVEAVGNVVDCIVPGRDKPKSFTGDTPWITTNDLKHMGITAKSEKAIGLTEAEIQNVKARIIPKGSVLMTCVGDLGVISIAGDNIVMNQQLHAFLINEKIKRVFLMYVLSFQKCYMLKMASSTTVPYMNKTICNSVPIILPDVNLQDKFEAIYLKLNASLNVQIASNEYNSELFNSLSQKAFAGEL
jgi:type I restriction enzyme S subunit